VFATKSLVHGRLASLAVAICVSAYLGRTEYIATAQNDVIAQLAHLGMRA